MIFLVQVSKNLISLSRAIFHMRGYGHDCSLFTVVIANNIAVAARMLLFIHIEFSFILSVSTLT